MTTQTNLRLDNRARAQLKAIASAWETTEGVVMGHAIDLLYRAWTAEPAPTLPPTLKRKDDER